MNNSAVRKHFGSLAFTTVTYVLNGWCAILAYDGTVNSISFRYNSVVVCKLKKKIFTKKKEIEKEKKKKRKKEKKN